MARLHSSIVSLGKSLQTFVVVLPWLRLQFELSQERSLVQIKLAGFESQLMS